MHLYRAVLTHTDIQITVRIWSTTDHDWTWTPLDTWTPDPTPTTPAQLADELHRHGWTTPEDPTTLTKVTVIPENWQALVDHALAARNHQANQLRVAENILPDPPPRRPALPRRRWPFRDLPRPGRRIVPSCLLQTQR